MAHDCKLYSPIFYILGSQNFLPWLLLLQKEYFTLSWTNILLNLLRLLLIPLYHSLKGGIKWNYRRLPNISILLIQIPACVLSVTQESFSSSAQPTIPFSAWFYSIIGVSGTTYYIGCRSCSSWIPGQCRRWRGRRLSREAGSCGSFGRPSPAWVIFNYLSRGFKTQHANQLKTTHLDK